MITNGDLKQQIRYTYSVNPPYRHHLFLKLDFDVIKTFGDKTRENHGRKGALNFRLLGTLRRQFPQIAFQF